MARRPRILFPGARYHVINRGNLRHDIFATSGALRSFAGVTGEVCGEFDWRMHAYIVMRKHFHFTLETTPQPRLASAQRKDSSYLSYDDRLWDQFYRSLRQQLPMRGERIQTRRPRRRSEPRHDS
jgi:REP element-mobilizing transposase RayT